MFGTTKTASISAPPTLAEAGVNRYLIVGDGHELDQLRSTLIRCLPQIHITEVDGFLAALGELMHEPAQVVIGPLAMVEGAVDSSARALRKLAPSAKLILVAPKEQRPQAEAAVEAGFDAWLAAPFDSAAVARVLGVSEAHVVAADQVGSAEPKAAGPATVGSPDQAPPAASHQPTIELGDVDLVESIMSGRGRLRATALRIIAARSGIEDVQWTAADDQVPQGRTAAPVTYHGRCLGILHSAAASGSGRLGRWADWIGRWLALDDRVSQLKDMSMRDELTGVWNRRYFNHFLARILYWAKDDRSQVTLLIFDIDDFKVYNDRYGHLAGDDILCEATRLMSSSVRDQDVVARIGGDEFAVVFWDAGARRRPDSRHPEDVAAATKRFQQAVCAHRFPKLLDEAPGTLTISGGLACFPWDGQTPTELLARADEMVLQSKRQGKNVITFGPGAMRVCSTIA